MSAGQIPFAAAGVRESLKPIFMWIADKSYSIAPSILEALFIEFPVA